MNDNESLDFYKDHAGDYARNVEVFLDKGYTDPSHPQMATEDDLFTRLKSLVPGKKGLDAGCGAAGLQVYMLWRDGFDAYGVDAVPENIQMASEVHPEIADRISVGDLTQPLPYTDGSFDFVICNAVIQHIRPEIIKQVTLPEMVRVLRTGGVLQLMFKNGTGVETVLDPDYDVTRTFQLYDPQELSEWLKTIGCTLIEPEAEGMVGGFMYLTDSKPMRHCLFHARKQ